MARLPIRNVNLGGIADSDFLGAANSVADMIGFDIHSEAGIMKVNQALSLESGSTVDGFVKAGVACSDGNTYLFSQTNAKVWQRDDTGAYTLVATISTPTGGSVVGACEYYGYIYYATNTYLGRWQIGTAWSTRNDTYQTFLNGDTEWHPMLVLNLVLYIGDNNVVAQVDSSGGTDIFSDTALKLGREPIATCLGQLGTDLLVGTYVESNVVKSQLFRWNTWSVSFTSAHPIPEVGINAFIPMQNAVIVNAGTKGNMYVYNGSSIVLYKGIKGNWDGTTNQGRVRDQAAINFNGLPIFGLSSMSGDPAKMAIYSLGQTNSSYPIVLNCEVGISTGNLSNLVIGTIIAVGDTYIVTWVDNATGTPVYGVDVYDFTTKYASPYVVTRVTTAEAIRTRRIANTTQSTRSTKINAGVVNVGYRNMPTNCSIDIAASINYGDFNDIDDVSIDTDRNIVYTEVDVNEMNTIQVMVSPVVIGNDAPDIDVIELTLDI